MAPEPSKAASATIDGAGALTVIASRTMPTTVTVYAGPSGAEIWARPAPKPLMFWSGEYDHNVTRLPTWKPRWLAVVSSTIASSGRSRRA